MVITCTPCKGKSSNILYFIRPFENLLIWLLPFQGEFSPHHTKPRALPWAMSSSALQAVQNSPEKVELSSSYFGKDFYEVGNLLEDIHLLFGDSVIACDYPLFEERIFQLIMVSIDDITIFLQAFQRTVNGACAIFARL